MAAKKPRSKIKAQIKSYLLDHGAPRFQAFLIVLFVGANTLGATGLLTWLGVKSMPLRYAIVVTYGYLIFFVAIHWLIKYYLYRQRFKEDLGKEVESHLENEGYYEPSSDESDVDFEQVWDHFSFSFELQELALLIIPLLLGIGAILFTFHFLFIAPTFLAEILLDAIIMAYVFNGVKKAQSQHWAITLQKRTFWVYLVILAVLCTAGWLMQRIFIDVVTIGDVFR